MSAGSRDEGDRQEPHPVLDAQRMTRRNAARFLAGLAGAAAIGTFAIPYLGGVARTTASAADVAAAKAIKHVQGTRLVTQGGDPVTVDLLPAGSGKSTTVFPEAKGGGPLRTRSSAVLLLRFDASQFKAPTNLGGVARGYVAYSKVCPHQGCPVSGRYKRYVYCPCHLAVFDPLAGARVVGGPSPRPLPQLPIGVDTSGNVLVATGPFDGPVGPTYY